MRTSLTITVGDDGSLTLEEPPGVRIDPLDDKSDDTTPSGHSIQLVLVDEETGTPLDSAGLTVSLLDSRNRMHPGTIADGTARWEGLDPDTFRVIVDDSNFSDLA